MIDDLIFGNLIKKFNREIAKNNREEAIKVIERIEKLGETYREDMMVYFTIRNMKRLISL